MPDALRMHMKQIWTESIKLCYVLTLSERVCDRHTDVLSQDLGQVVCGRKKAGQLRHIYISVLCPNSQGGDCGNKDEAGEQEWWSNVLCLVINENAEFPQVC